MMKNYDVINKILDQFCYWTYFNNFYEEKTPVIKTSTNKKNISELK